MKLTSKTRCQYGEWSNVPPLNQVWHGRDYIPLYEDAVTGKNALNNVPLSRKHGAYDWDSVMMYGTFEPPILHRLVNGVLQDLGSFGELN